jgi:hypothetical protein
MPDSVFCWQKKVAFVNMHFTMTRDLKPLFANLDGGLLELARGASAATAFAALVRQSLPEQLRRHVVTATRRGDDLVVVVESAAWAARVRYAGPRLRKQLEAASQPVTGKIRVRVGRPAASG